MSVEQIPLRKVALVTGAARGIGREIAQVLSEEGIAVASADLGDVDSAQPLAGSGHTEHRVDVRSEDSCKSLVAEVLAHHGRIDYLVNNAGIVRRGPASEMSELDFKDVIEVNLVGAFLMCQAVYGALTDSRGSIVNIGSTNGFIAVPNTVGYCVSKAGIMHLSRVLALEWGSHGIRVNSVAPTIVATEMTSDVRADPTYMKEKLSSIPLGRMATPRDVANAVKFLVSEDAQMVTGQTIFVDGGVVVR